MASVKCELLNNLIDVIQEREAETDPNSIEQLNDQIKDLHVALINTGGPLSYKMCEFLHIITNKCCISFGELPVICKWFGDECTKLDARMLNGFNLDKKTVRDYDNRALLYACKKGLHNIVEYLFNEGGLTADDIRADNGRAFILAIRNGNYDNILYFCDILGLKASDCVADSNRALLVKCEKGGYLSTMKRFCTDA